MNAEEYPQKFFFLSYQRAVYSYILTIYSDLFLPENNIQQMALVVKFELNIQ